MNLTGPSYEAMTAAGEKAARHHIRFAVTQAFALKGATDETVAWANEIIAEVRGSFKPYAVADVAVVTADEFDRVASDEFEALL